MRPGAALLSAARHGLLGALALAVPLLVTSCDSGSPPDPTPSDSPPPTGGEQVDAARDRLAALAAAAEDRHLVASYRLTTEGRAERTVTLTAAADGTWRVDIPGGALGGTADVAMAQTHDGVFQCALTSTQRPEPPTCVRVAAPDQQPASRVDPRVQHLFTDWLGVLTDRQAPLSVSPARTLPGARGTCFSVDSTSASLSAPLDVGIYCYDQDGTLTAARLALGTLLLVGTPAAAPPTITLPGPVTGGEALGMTAPPTPTAGLSPSTSTGN
ncbi:hypothetical protein AB0J86_28035 [Micromonospora sp. NPDC049559]|uniref:hypothetical protein n=1 Tax=Micromonospora sp. NPDC049559 TaxID=3155923 RepID=UPI00342A5D00